MDRHPLLPPDYQSLPGPSTSTETRRRFSDGSWAVQAGFGRLLTALFIDAVIVLAPGAALYLAVMTRGTGIRIQAIADGLLLSTAIALVYGLLCFSGNSIGTLLAGTRIVRAQDGRAPGPAAAWIMAARTLLYPAFPVAGVIASINARDKSLPFGCRTHLSILSRADSTPLQAHRLDRELGLDNAALLPVPAPPPPPPSEDSITAITGHRPLLASRFKDGSWGVQPGWKRIMLAWFVDAAVTAGIVTAFVGAAAPAYAGSPEGRDVTIGFLVLWVPWIFGSSCFLGHTPGTLLAGTRLVKTRNGRAPGFWRGGWLMFQRMICYPLMPVFLLLDFVDHRQQFPRAFRAFHVSIDRRRTAGLRAGTWRP